MLEPLIMFVCTGNICRSPMAEYMFRRRAEHRLGWHSCSAGTMAVYGLPASPPAVAVLADEGIDLTPHHSRPLTPELVDAARLVVVMAALHGDQLRGRFPDAAGKLFLIRHFDPDGGGRDVDDPIGLPVARYRQVRDEIDAALPGLISFAERLQS